MRTSFKSVFWVSYAFLLALYTLVLLLLIPNNIDVVVEVFILIASAVGLWGYIVQRRIGISTVWFVAAALNVLWIAYGFIYSIVSGNMTMIVLNVVATIVSLPLVVALYRYSSKSPHIWRPVEVDA